jgi:hypothetical protein
MSDQYAIEARCLMSLRKARDVVRIDNRPLGWMDL